MRLPLALTMCALALPSAAQAATAGALATATILRPARLVTTVTPDGATMLALADLTGAIVRTTSGAPVEYRTANGVKLAAPAKDGSPLLVEYQ